MKKIIFLSLYFLSRRAINQRTNFLLDFGGFVNETEANYNNYT